MKKFKEQIEIFLQNDVDLIIAEVCQPFFSNWKSLKLWQKKYVNFSF